MLMLTRLLLNMSRTEDEAKVSFDSDIKSYDISKIQKNESRYCH
jgi:hypothetical protein